MYDDPFAEDFNRWRHQPAYEPFGPAAEALDRLTHLVLVDGRLVETWSEPVRGTRWQEYADRFDREHQPPPPPPTPHWQRALDWLGGVCGGREAVDGLTADPLPDVLEDEACQLPMAADAAARSRLESAADLLGAVAERWFVDPEMATALRRALLQVWEDDPEAVLRARTPAHLAGGVCWAVGKANGCFRPQGDLTMARVQEALGLTTAISGYGTTVRVALVGFRSVGHDTWWRRPEGVPTLEPLGRPDLLTSTTRRRLLRVRERAQEARTAAA